MATTKGVTATRALLLSSSEEWYSLGQEGGTTFTDDFSGVVDGVTSLLLIRVIAMNKATEYDDLSTTSIATVIVNTGDGEWPIEVVTPSTVEQLQSYVTHILRQYQNVPFHNFLHCYHVVLCATKLIDQVLLTDANKNDSRRRPPPTYGLRTDPTALMALIFAGLVHDAGHPGITNRQRVEEQDEMAIRYNDESIHENHALSLAFGELLKSDYGELRRAMFPTDAHYRYFRKIVIDSVLSTDLASPARIQISRSKFQEAFSEEGEVLMWNDEGMHGRRFSIQSSISKPKVSKTNPLAVTKSSRRDSTHSVSSVISDISTDSNALMRQQQANAPSLLTQPRRMSNLSVDSLVSDYDSVHFGSNGSNPKNRNVNRNLSMDSTDSMLNYVEKALKGEPIRRGARRASVEGTTSLHPDELHQQSKSERSQSLNDSGGVSGADSSFADSLLAAESIDLAQKRKKGQGFSRSRGQAETNKKNNPGAKYFAYGDEDDDLSLTPPSSDDEMEGVIITGASGKGNFNPAASSSTPKRMSRRRSSVQNRRNSTSSTAVFNIEEEDPENMNESARDLAVEIEAKHHGASGEALAPALGIRRSIDLSGEAIDQYSVRDSVSVCSLNPELMDDTGLDFDQPDEFRTSVVIELLLRVSDVSYWFQSEDIFIRFSGRLLQELFDAHGASRGMDPRPKWVQNQLNMAQQYLAVLALQVQRTGIFGRNFDFWFPIPDDDLSGEWRFPSHVVVKPLTALK